jgi:predicted nucleic acid-binding protein
MTEGQAVLCDMVRLELWNGARGTAEHRMLRDLERELESVPTSSEVWDLATDLGRNCRRKGLTIPAADLLIAACARHHRLGVVHADRHFDEIDAV